MARYYTKLVEEDDITTIMGIRLVIFMAAVIKLANKKIWDVWRRERVVLVGFLDCRSIWLLG